ncbi:MAG: GAF domain-containing protein, partial [Lautropia sp.]|nr:GAF domain-containing protein [Lautropia sp.]
MMPSDYHPDRSLDDVRESESRLRFLAQVAQATEPLTDAAVIMQVTARLLGEHLQASRCAYAEVEADEDRFLITGDYNHGVASIVGRFAFSDFGEAVLFLMRTNKPYIVDDVDADPRTAHMDKTAYRITSIQAVICVPLHKDGRFVAAMAVHQNRARQWKASEIDLVRLVVARCWESLERSRSERRLIQTNSRLSLALEAASMGDWTWDAATDVVALSPRTEELLGLDCQGEIRWSQFRSCISEADLPVVDEAVERTRLSGTRYKVEYRFNTPGGRQIWLGAWGIAQHTNDGGFSGISGVLQDVTVRKQLEQELHANAAALMEADRRKDEFLATLAHELRNPLAPIRTAAEILHHPGLSAEQALTAASVVRRQVSQMSRLLDDLLDVARITRGQLHLKKERVSLRSIVSSAVETAGPLIDARGHRLVLRVDGAEEEVLADPVRLTQILSNLLSNAAKYTDPGGTITVSSQATNEARVLRVADTGIGLTPDATHRIFGMFTQETSVLKRSQGGLGIGLALAKGLANLHEGTIAAFSEGLGKGSEFVVTLPPAPAYAQEAPTSAAVRPKSAARQKVLVADDNQDAAESVAAFLRLEGHEVQIAADGEAALRLAREVRPGVIILD